MSKEIGVGDLVRVASACCTEKRIRHGGMVFTVVRIYEVVNVVCKLCGTRFPSVMVARFAEQTMHGHNRAPLSWLRKIPPLTEPETQTEREDIREPV